MELFKKQDEDGNQSTDWRTLATMAAVTAVVTFVVTFGMKVLFRAIGWDK